MRESGFRLGPGGAAEACSIGVLGLVLSGWFPVNSRGFWCGGDQGVINQSHRERLKRRSSVLLPDRALRIRSDGTVGQVDPSLSRMELA